MSVRVLVADDQRLIRAGFVALVESAGDPDLGGARVLVLTTFEAAAAIRRRDV